MPATQNDRASWLHGPQHACSNPGLAPERSRRFILLGAPGVGKGTQAQLLQRHFSCCPLSTGDVFRAAKAGTGSKTEAMEDALGYMTRGELVPDETVIALVRERSKCLHCQHGFLLDGFPRTVAQARRLDALMEELQLSFDAVISYELDQQEVITRLSGRRTCTGCGRTYHLLHHPPQKAGVCDHCSARLFQREDDQPATIEVRLKAYEESTAPLIAHYEAQGILLRIDATGGPEGVFLRTLEALGESHGA